jgi:RNA polymerase sigma factor (sigma-70 family)
MPDRHTNDAETPEIDYDALNTDLFTRRRAAQSVLDDPDANSRAKRKARIEFDAVTNDIYELNRPLVASIVKRYTRMASQDLADEYEANAWVGMAKAVENFDPEKGKFSSWAWRPINREVTRAVRQNEFSLPPADFEARPRVLVAVRRLTEELGRTPSYAEVSEASEVNEDSVRRIMDHRATTSLNRPVGDEEGVELADLIVDDTPDPFDQIEVRRALAAVEEHAMPVLTDRERMVVVRRFGLDGEPPEGLTSIGQTINLSREAVRQIEARARAKMLHPIIARKLQYRGRSGGVC